MKPEDLKLFEFLECNEKLGTIRFNNRRMLIFEADAMGLLRKELIESLGLDRARRLLTRFGYACGYRDALTSKELFSWESDEEWLAAGPRLHTLEGIVRVQPLRLIIDRQRGAFEVEVEWLNSYEAEQHLNHIGKSDSPTCWTLTGYACGYSAACFGQDVVYLERECLGKGDSRCFLVGKAAWEESDEVRFALACCKAENFSAEMERILHELEKRSIDLARQQEHFSKLESQVSYLKEAIKEVHNFEEMVGASPAFKKLMRDVETVAWSDSTVLILGETGTGKELVARAIHARSSRFENPLVTVNCAALPMGLIESELFGHEKGAFTGALHRKLGRFELANGATIFLDEVGELSVETQSKLLRVLESGEFERVGGTGTLKVDVRVLAASNRQLDQLVEEGKFRSDLFYRLNVFPITVPTLRARVGDIRLLANFFAQKYRSRFGKKITAIDETSIQRLECCDWPGNIRELEHVIERAVLMAQGEVLTIDLPLCDPKGASAAIASSSKLLTLGEIERNYIQDVLRRTGGHIAGKGGAAEILGLPPSTLRSRIKKLRVK
jgi:DNA-binding NtrC family response regulator